MNPSYKICVRLGMRNNIAECFIGTAEGVFRACESRRLESQSRRDNETNSSVIGVVWRLTDGKWTVGRPEVRVDSISIPPLPFAGARVQKKRITKQGTDEFGASVGVSRLQRDQGQETGTRPPQIVAECESKIDSR